MRDMHFREMSADDIARVADIGSHSSQSPWNENSVLTYFLRDDTLFAVAEEEDPEGGGMAVRGFAALLLTPPESDVIDIVVEPEARCRGMGRQLLDWLCDLALLRGVDTIFLEVRPGNLPARRIYDRLGFIQCGIRKGYYQDPPEDAIAMVRRRHIIMVNQ